MRRPALRDADDRAAAEVGLETLSDEEWLNHFGRFNPLPGQPGPVAMRYHGHQFRTYNPDIGDEAPAGLERLAARGARIEELLLEHDGLTEAGARGLCRYLLTPSGCVRVLHGLGRLRLSASTRLKRRGSSPSLRPAAGSSN